MRRAARKEDDHVLEIAPVRCIELIQTMAI
jgi:hypothetical protein